ncbi:predicted protein [Chaetoceros tenuissimus]|uniref:Uncharacterized protein n=1 Tax=Chaetoceros tenuissimus TaxID=426638 RepID=A0AAD3CJZ6_9STRA|nr:predicted protein [Chaetoceros tenuissimus]
MRMFEEKRKRKASRKVFVNIFLRVFFIIATTIGSNLSLHQPFQARYEKTVLLEITAVPGSRQNVHHDSSHVGPSEKTESAIKQDAKAFVAFKGNALLIARSEDSHHELNHSHKKDDSSCVSTSLPTQNIFLLNVPVGSFTRICNGCSTDGKNKTMNFAISFHMWN